MEDRYDDVISYLYGINEDSDIGENQRQQMIQTLFDLKEESARMFAEWHYYESLVFRIARGDQTALEEIMDEDFMK